MKEHNKIWCHLFLYAVVTVAMLGMAAATENGGTPYPAGVDTVMPALNPKPGETMIFNYNNFYTAYENVNSNGKNVVPNFGVRVYATAFKVIHTWDLHVLGGDLQTNAAFPFVYQRLRTPDGTHDQFALGNVQFAPLGVGYHLGKEHNFHLNYEVAAFFPGTAYSKYNPVNIGQHYYSLGPDASFTWLPKKGKYELSSKFTYLVNFNDVSTNYQNGQQFSWEFDGMREVNRKIALGINGYWFQQTTDDRINNVIVGDGNRRRTVSIGPEMRINLPHGGCAFKYTRDVDVQNAARGDSFWFQWGLPIRFGGHAEK